MRFQTATSRGAPLASALAAFAAGILTAFTVSIGGELPLGELVLILVFFWVLFHGLVTGLLPPEIPRTRLFRVLLVCQAIAFAAYVFSDFYRHSTVHDMERGWARMVFLAIDIIAVAYLIGCSRLNLLMFIAGQLMGDCLHSVAFGALYGDKWKFGFGTPVTFLVLFLAAQLGRPALVVAAFLMSFVHLVMDFRSFGGICFAVGAATLITLFPRRTRPWLAIPALLIGLLATAGYAYKHHGDHRATRSNVSRSAMLKAAYEGFMSSPLIGQGSWFSKSPVFDNFMRFRADNAKVAGVGGFPEADEAPGSVAFHSQILVALAEGGVFGASFFLAFGAALVAAIGRLIFMGEGGRYTGIYLLILISALFNWMLSPFSGAHRVYIAIACGLLVLLQRPRPAPVESRLGGVNPEMTPIRA